MIVGTRADGSDVKGEFPSIVCKTILVAQLGVDSGLDFGLSPENADVGFVGGDISSQAGEDIRVEATNISLIYHRGRQAKHVAGNAKGVGAGSTLLESDYEVMVRAEVPLAGAEVLPRKEGLVDLERF